MKIRLLHLFTITLLAIGLWACEKPVDTAPTPKVSQASVTADNHHAESAR